VLVASCSPSSSHRGEQYAARSPRLEPFLTAQLLGQAVDPAKDALPSAWRRTQGAQQIPVQ